MGTNGTWKTMMIVTSIISVVVIGLLLWWNVYQDPVLTGVLVEPGDLTDDDMTGYTRANGVMPMPFPETYGPHPDFRTEWWYYTGNLETDDGRPFGYQLTFFRQRLVPLSASSPTGSDWRSDQIYFAHFTLTDVVSGQFTFHERFSRPGAGLAGAQAEPYMVWLEDWEVRQTGDGEYQLYASQDGVSISLTLVDEKGPVLQGVEGFSQKGPEPGNASYYYSQPRFRSIGTIRVGDEQFDVSGWSWKDHEFSTSVLSDGQIGWDWFSLHLDDGTDLMLYSFRRSDGTSDPFSSGIMINADGSTDRFSPEDYTITTLNTWVSPESGAEYPSGWRIQIPSANLDLTLTPYLPNQELLVTVVYWEGAVEVSGSRAGQMVSGAGYVELTGYESSMTGWL